MTMWRLRVSRLVPKATNTHFRNIQYRLLLYCNNGRTNAPQFYVRGYTFPLLLLFEGAFAKSDYWIRNACLSDRMEQLGSHCTNFHENLYLSIFRKSAQEFQISLKYDENNGYFT